MTRISGGSSRLTIGAIAVLAGACGGVNAHDTGEDDKAIESYLLEHGYDPKQFVIGATDIRIDEDMIIGRNGLIQLIADEARERSTGKLEEKAYYQQVSFTPVILGGSGAAPLVFNFSSRVSASWRDAFRYAAARWNEAGAECMSFAEGVDSSGHRNIPIIIGEAGTSSTGSPAGASAGLPTIDGKGLVYVGHPVTLDYDVEFTTNTSYQRNTAMHELGHTLGFTHPAGRLIAGTAASSTGCNSSGCTASYPTVMDYNYVETALTTDDINATRLIFRKRPGFHGVPQCGPYTVP